MLVMCVRVCKACKDTEAASDFEGPPKIHGVAVAVCSGLTVSRLSCMYGAQFHLACMSRHLGPPSEPMVAPGV
jgi:hypothetical protein